MLAAFCNASPAAPLFPQGPQSNRADAPFRLAQFSDSHYTGKHYHDAAVISATAELKRGGYDALVYTGDLGDNSQNPQLFYQRYPLACQQFSKSIADYRAPLLFALGNDDLAHNYQTSPTDLEQTRTALREALGDRYYLDELGNGTYPKPVAGAYWISINSMVFGSKNTTPQAANQAQKTLAWLRTELAKCQDRPVFILTHLPPTWDLWLEQPSWKPEHIQALQEILSHYPGQVVIIAGHYHRNHIQLLDRGPERPTVPVLTAGALANKYGYASNWRSLSFSHKLFTTTVASNEPGESPTVLAQTRIERINYEVHYPQHRDWDTAYSLPLQRPEEFWDNLMANTTLFRRYVADIFGHDKSYLTRWKDDQLKEALSNQFRLEYMPTANSSAPSEKE